MKPFIIGFGKGLLVILIYGVVLLALESVTSKEHVDNAALGINALVGLAFTGYYVYKRGIPKVWIIFGSMIGTIIVPFLLASVEKNPKT